MATIKILVTGSSGFIGREVVAQAQKLGYYVIGVDVKETQTKAPNEMLIKDICQVREEDMKGCKYVIHLAAEVTPQRVFEKNLFENFTTNITGFLNVIEAARRAKVKKFVYASSSAVYGRYMHEDPIIKEHGVDENEPVYYADEQNHYGKSKMINEAIAQSYHDAFGMCNIGLRVMNAFGCGEESKNISACAPSQMILQKAREQKITVYGDGKQAKDFIYITDCATIILKLMEKAGDGVYNVGTGIETDFNTIAKLVGGSSKHVPNPNTYYPLLTKADMTKTLEAIGKYKFIKIEEGIERAKHYYGVD